MVETKQLNVVQRESTLGNDSIWLKVSSSEWLIPALLILLSLVPAGGGLVRFWQLTSGADVTPENARFFSSPIPIILHLVSVVIFSFLGAFQFGTGLRKRQHRWHRRAGWLLVPCGLLTALSGLWMAHFYTLPSYDGVVLYVTRMIVGAVMVASIVLGILEIQRKNYTQHAAWMMRSYALGMGAGTQVLTIGPWFFFFGMPGEFPRAVLMAASWIINISVAEWVIRRMRRENEDKS